MEHYRPVCCPYCASTFIVPVDPLAARRCLWCRAPLAPLATDLYCNSDCFIAALRYRSLAPKGA